MAKPESPSALAKGWVLAWSLSQADFCILPVADLLRQNLRTYFAVSTEGNDWLVLGVAEGEEDLRILRERLEEAMDEPAAGGDLLAQFSAVPLRHQAKVRLSR